MFLKLSISGMDRKSRQRLEKKEDQVRSVSRSKPILDWFGVTIVGLILAFLGSLSFIILEFQSSHPLSWVWTWTAGLAIIVAVPITHGFAGTRRFRHYSFFQPFVGGTVFVLLQSSAWTIYGLMLFTIISGIAHALPGGLASAGIGGLLAQILVASSLYFFDSRRKNTAIFQHRDGRPHNWVLDARSIIITSLFYQIPVLVLTLWILCFTLGGAFIGVGALLFVIIYYKTFAKDEHHTGEKSWPRFRGWNEFWSSMEHYFSFTLIPHGKLSPEGVYMYGFHPHGIYPLTAFWSTRGYKWQLSYPDVHLDILAASVVFSIPIMREIALWAGGRDVSRKSINHALQSQTSVLLVPGGEREMRETRPESVDITLVTSHKGFIKLALQNGADLVPVLSFGENQTLDNFRAKPIQEWFQKRTLYGFPHIPYGRWYSPIPNAVPITVVVGDPIPVHVNKEPSSQDIDKLHQIYFKALLDLHSQYKTKVPGFEESNLIFTPPIDWS